MDCNFALFEQYISALALDSKLLFNIFMTSIDKCFRLVKDFQN